MNTRDRKIAARLATLASTIARTIAHSVAVWGAILCVIAAGAVAAVDEADEDLRRSFEGRSFEQWFEIFAERDHPEHRRSEVALHKMLPHERTLRMLVEFYEEPGSPAQRDWRLRDRVLFVLGNLSYDAKEALDTVFGATRDEALPVRRRAVWALRRISVETVEMRSGLVALMTDPDAQIRREAESALAGQREALSDVSGQVAQLIRDPQLSVRLAALRILRQVGSDVALPLLETAMVEFGVGASSGAVSIDRVAGASDGESISQATRWALVTTVASFGAGASPLVPRLRAEMSSARVDAPEAAAYRTALARAIESIETSGRPVVMPTG